MAVGGIWTRITGGVVALGVGAAARDAIEPVLEVERQQAWARRALRVLGPHDAADALVKGIDHGVNYGDDMKRGGIGQARRGVMVDLARQHPDLPVALALWRRGYVGYDDVYLYLRRHGYADGIIKALIGDRGGPFHLKNERLAPAQIALGIVRSIIEDKTNLMPVQLDTTGGVVKAYPVSSIDAIQEAEDNGFNREHLRVLVGEIGLPMSAQQAASALFRGIIEQPDFNRAILEGDTRPEWAHAIREQARQILTANQYAELQLRGFITETRRRELTAQHGMSDLDSNHLFDVLGRSINVHQIVTGEARGGTYKPPPDTLAQQEAGIPPAFLASLQRGNLRPEYYNLAYANRFTYPSFFAIRGLLQGGVFATADAGYEILLEMGWKPSLARIVADFYWQPAAGTTKASPLVKSAQTSAITEIRSAYLIGQADGTQARDWLGRIGVDAAEIDGMIPIWDVMREVPQKGLTAKQIVVAYQSLPTQWPRPRAVAALQMLGLTLDDANTLLDE